MVWKISKPICQAANSLFDELHRKVIDVFVCDLALIDWKIILQVLEGNLGANSVIWH